jgi:hypothetical protein
MIEAGHGLGATMVHLGDWLDEYRTFDTPSSIVASLRQAHNDWLDLRTHVLSYLTLPSFWYAHHLVVQYHQKTSNGIKGDGSNDMATVDANGKGKATSTSTKRIGLMLGPRHMDQLLVEGGAGRHTMTRLRQVEAELRGMAPPVTPSSSSSLLLLTPPHVDTNTSIDATNNNNNKYHNSDSSLNDGPPLTFDMLCTMVRSHHMRSRDDRRGSTQVLINYLQRSACSLLPLSITQRLTSSQVDRLRVVAGGQPSAALCYLRQLQYDHAITCRLADIEQHNGNIDNDHRLQPIEHNGDVSRYQSIDALVTALTNTHSSSSMPRNQLLSWFSRDTCSIWARNATYTTRHQSAASSSPEKKSRTSVASRSSSHTIVSSSSSLHHSSINHSCNKNGSRNNSPLAIRHGHFDAKEAISIGRSRSPHSHISSHRSQSPASISSNIITIRSTSPSVDTAAAIYGLGPRARSTATTSANSSTLSSSRLASSTTGSTGSSKKQRHGYGQGGKSKQEPINETVVTHIYDDVAAGQDIIEMLQVQDRSY